MATVDDYLEGLDQPSREAFARVLSAALAEAPEAEQGTSYGMAALIYKRRPLLGFRAAKRHLSVFPFSPAVVESVRDRLTGFELSKGTIRFTVDTPVADDVVRDIVRRRMAEIAGGTD